MPHNLWSQDSYIQAYRFAAEAHHGQLVPGTQIPYLMHISLVCMEVTAALCAEPAHDPTLAVQCALLHDVIEDTPATFEAVRAVFGAPVADGVLALTKDKHLEKPLQMEDSLRRIRQQPREVWLVKLADRITNLQPPPAAWTSAKISAYQAEARQILAALGGASPLLAARLEQKINTYGNFVGG